MKTKKVCEWCPFCETEEEYEVGENEMIVNCKFCGRPIILCDDCYPHDNCGNCKWVRKVNRMLAEWEQDQMGKLVMWKDGNGGKLCRIDKIDDCRYVLRRMDVPSRTFEAVDGDFDSLTDEQMVEAFICFFSSGVYVNGEVAI